MDLRKFLQSLGILTGVLSPVPLSFAGLLPLLPVQSHPTETLVSIQFPPTEQRGAPTRTVGGGTRSGPYSCTQADPIPLTALMPTQNNTGTTVSAHPTFFVYVPQTTARLAEFTVSDPAGNRKVHQRLFPLAGPPGVIKLDLPTTTVLEAGKTYQWKFALICDPLESLRDELVEGQIQRVELSPDLQVQLEQAAPLERAKLYAEQRIWQDTLTILAQLRNTEPEQWEELLNSVGLGELAQEPLVECCTAEK